MNCDEAARGAGADLLWERRIVSGQCLGIEIGARKSAVAERLIELGVTFVWLTPPAMSVETVAGLEKLVGSEAIYVGEMEIYVVFDGDVVSERLIASHIPGPLREAFEAAMNKEQVFKVLRKLVSEGSYTVSSYHSGPTTVDLVPGELENHDLVSVDHWDAAVRTDDGFWSLGFEFDGGILKELNVRFSEIELP